MPSATSSAIEPVGMTPIGTRTSSPRRMTEPLAEALVDLREGHLEGLLAVRSCHVELLG
jgi:hypothetical protein